MQVEPVDPRTTSWEIDAPAYRVYLWTQSTARAGIAADRFAGRSSEFEIRGAADVGEAVDWAERAASEANAEGTPTTYTLYVFVPDRLGAGAGLIQIAGTRPSEGD